MQPNPITKLNHEQRPSYGKQNTLSYSIYEPTDRQQNDHLLKQFQTLKQINRILDSDPQSDQSKDHKIRSLVVMFKRQLDINKKLQTQLADHKKIIQGLQRQLLIRNTQVQNYSKTIFQQKQTFLTLETQNKKLTKIIAENQEQINVRQELIQKMKDTHQNQKYSMENQLHFLKHKTLQHFTQKLNFPIHSWQQTKDNTSHSKPIQNSSNSKQDLPNSKQNKSGNSKQNKSGKSQSIPKRKSSKKDIIRKNILAISKKENELMSGENLLKKFEQTKLLSERMSEIRKGNYHSAMGQTVEK